jgi:hypothetical protein
VSLRRGSAQNTPVRVIVPLLLALVAGVAIGLARDEPDRPLAADEREVAEVARRTGPVLRAECAPVRDTPNRWSCVAVRWETELGYGGDTYQAARDRRTGRWRISRFEIPLWWGV